MGREPNSHSPSCSQIHTAHPFSQGQGVPTRRLLNMSPALLISYFGTTFRALLRLTFPVQSLTAYRHEQSTTLRESRDKSASSEVDPLAKANKPCKQQSWDGNSVLLVLKKISCGRFLLKKVALRRHNGHTSMCYDLKGAKIPDQLTVTCCTCNFRHF